MTAVHLVVVAISYKAGDHCGGIGNTDGDGKAAVELFPGTYTFQPAHWRHRRHTRLCRAR